MFFPMSVSQYKQAKNLVGRFLEHRSDPTTRNKAYEILFNETGIPIGTLRVVFHRLGLTDKLNSLKLALPPEREMALVVICLLYSRAGNPLTIRDFIEIASKMAGKEDGDLFTQKFATFFF